MKSERFYWKVQELLLWEQWAEFWALVEAHQTQPPVSVTESIVDTLTCPF